MCEDLKQRSCVPCRGGEPPLTGDAVNRLLSRTEGWSSIENNTKLEKEYSFKNFKKAMAFVNAAAEIAEQEDHHPDIFIHSWNKVKLTIYTHVIGGLSENDFILAAKIDDI